jgi:LytS/YehU family sensor histidine kinase
VYFGLELILDYHAARLDASEAREVARAAELKQLQTQLNPHFLFNALNTVIASLEPGHQTREIVKNLADYLRFSLHEARPLEPLGRELEALESYFELQRVRFQEGLRCGIACTPEAMRVLVPPMLVQPLLENAFKYGPMSSPLPLSVDVEAAVAAGWLEIRVTNSGAWVPPGSGDSHGSGLASLRRRLSLLVGDVATLQIDEGAERVCVTIRIPADLPAK